MDKLRPDLVLDDVEAICPFLRRTLHDMGYIHVGGNAPGAAPRQNCHVFPGYFRANRATGHGDRFSQRTGTALRAALRYLSPQGF